MPSELLTKLQAVSAASGFDSWAGLKLDMAENGKATLLLPSRPDLLQQSGFLHAGVLGALIDRSCGFAAASIVGAVLGSQYSVRCYRPATGKLFIAKAEVVRAGKRQVFASAEVFAVDGGEERLVAGGDTILITVA